MTVRCKSCRSSPACLMSIHGRLSDDDLRIPRLDCIPGFVRTRTHDFEHAGGGRTFMRGPGRLYALKHY